MTSRRLSEPDGLDFERDLPTSPEDVEALRRARAWPVGPEEYSRFLAGFGHLTYEQLVARKGPRGEPFEL